MYGMADRQDKTARHADHHRDRKKIILFVSLFLKVG